MGTHDPPTHCAGDDRQKEGPRIESQPGSLSMVESRQALNRHPEAPPKDLAKRAARFAICLGDSLPCSNQITAAKKTRPRDPSPGAQDDELFESN